ncbi:MAG TPA: hypothetical protein VG410_14855 [Solirubrobacteraceae bacterium]|nr:hypothetical protein [Solirubrobacteraceae bacterium]
MVGNSHSLDRQVAAIVRVLERQRRRATEVSRVRRVRTAVTPAGAGPPAAQPARTDRASG